MASPDNPEEYPEYPGISGSSGFKNPEVPISLAPEFEIQFLSRFVTRLVTEEFGHALAGNSQV